MSLLGDMSSAWSSLWFKNFTEKYDIKPEFITAGKNKMKINPFEELSPES